MYCEKCGKELMDGAAFCSGCGRPLTDDSKSTRAEPTPQVQEPTGQEQEPTTVNTEETTAETEMPTISKAEAVAVETGMPAVARVEPAAAEAETAASAASASPGSRVGSIVIIIALVLGAIFLFNTCSSGAKQGGSDRLRQEQQQQARPSTLGEWLNSSQEEYAAFGSDISSEMAAWNLWGLFSERWEVIDNDIKLTFTVRTDGFETDSDAEFYRLLGMDQLAGSFLSEALEVDDFIRYVTRIEQAYDIKGVTITVSYVDLNGYPLFTAKYNDSGLIM